MHFIDNKTIADSLKRRPSRKHLAGIFERAKQRKGLHPEDVGILANIDDPELINKMQKVAGLIKNEIYGNRLVLFAPLYISNYCINDCIYCGFHSSNNLKRIKLDMEQIRLQTEYIINMGHKRVLLEAGEHPDNTIDYVLDAIRTIYRTKTDKGNIRRVNVNIAATSEENYEKLKLAGIGTYQLFQETYHYDTYRKIHKGPKRNYDRQLYAHHRAMKAGIDDVGMGVLFGLYDYKYELVALIMHARELERRFGVGPHTISVPRWRPAKGVSPESAPYPVSDMDFLKIISIIRMAVPYTGIIISTREPVELRRVAFSIGVSQASAGSCTSPGGYSSKYDPENSYGQFTLYDTRSLDKVVLDCLKSGLLPSFCTACYRKDRTGEKFMSLAKPGDINKLCTPNAILTFKEYLLDYASDVTRKEGEKFIEHMLDGMDKKTKGLLIKLLNTVHAGKRDVYI
ncbi:MAG: [FeFe] hydrogenase H-cluster radical SAM maturase HydG [Candidatus Micrarchaeia archaeon]